MVSFSDTEARRTGASSEAIRKHYDYSAEFYSLWLDKDLTYSCALWREGDDLEAAQQRKLDWHVHNARAGDADRVLDVGFGWGSCLKRLAATHGVKSAVGLTLSPAQADFVRDTTDPRVEVILEGWEDHHPVEPYDAIVSVESFEHFVRPDHSSEERARIYGQFFEKCHEWLKPNGRVTVQTNAYGTGKFQRGAIASIFPESDLPRLVEILDGAEPFFRTLVVRNDYADYVVTLRHWLDSLMTNREAASELVGEEVTKHYCEYLAAASRGFDRGIFDLFRLVFERR